MKFENISIIIPTFNRKQYLEKCVRSFIGQKYSGRYEIIIIDDGSSDATGDTIRKIKKNSKAGINYYYQPNSGVSAARNKGIKKAHFRYILFMDDDRFVDNDFLDKLNKRIRLTKNKSCFLVQLNSKNADENNDFGIIDEYLFTERIKSELKKNGGEYINILGGFFAVNRLYIKKYLFDENFKKTKEDFDLKIRLRKKIVFAKELEVYHYSRINLFDFMRQKFNYGLGDVLLFKKWGEQGKKHSYFDGRLITSFKNLWKHFGLKSIKFKLIFIASAISTIAGESYGKVEFMNEKDLKKVILPFIFIYATLIYIRSVFLEILNIN